MPINQQELGSRLRKIRESRGFTQEQIATVLGISRPAVVQLEAGNRALDSVELMKLSREFAFDPRQLFQEDFDAQRDSVTALFRSNYHLADDKELNKTVSDWSSMCRQFTTLEHLVGADRKVVTPAQYTLVPPRNKWEAIQQGSQVADFERNRLRLGTAPVLELPEIIESQGVRVGLLPLDDSISGLFLADEQNGLAILINSRHSESRQLFSFAHEYGHLLFDRQEKGNISRRADREEISEIRANAFAAGFLLPEQGIRESLASIGKGRELSLFQELYDEEGSPVRAQRREGAQPGAVQFYDVVHLAFYFGVSYESALWRLKSLRMISEEERESLASKDELALNFRHLLWEQKRRPRRAKHQENTFEHKLLMLALEAYRLGAITKSKLNEIAKQTSLSLDQFRVFAESIEPAEGHPSSPLIPG